jgi:hypothetical protein
MKVQLQRLVEKAKPSEPIRKCNLSNKDWTFFKSMKEVLNLFTEAMATFEDTSRPLIHEFLPMFDKMDDLLMEVVQNVDGTVHPVVVWLATHVFALFDKYYSFTDNSEFYRATLLLHPDYKLTYCTSHKWPDSWIQAVKDLLKNIWETRYCPKNKQPESIFSSPPPPTPSSKTSGKKGSKELKANHFALA